MRSFISFTLVALIGFAGTLAALGVGNQAGAITISFDGCVDDGFVSPSDTNPFIDCNGFRFTTATTPGGSTAFIEVQAASGNPGKALFNANGSEITMTTISGARFDFASFDFARNPNDDSDGSNSADRIDVFMFTDGAASATNTLPLTPAFLTKTLTTGQLGLISVLFRPEGCGMPRAASSVISCSTILLWKKSPPSPYPPLSPSTEPD